MAGLFFRAKLKKVPVAGGSVQTLSDAVMLHGASWSSKQIIAFKRPGVSAFQQVPAGGGASQPLVHVEKDEKKLVVQRWPDLLPGGDAVLFVFPTSSFDWTNTQISVQSIGTGERRDLIQGGIQPRYAASEHLIYAQAWTLTGCPFDPRRLVTTGPSAPMVEGVMQSSTTGT